MENYWIQGNNGKKEQLGDAKHGVRKEQLDKKFHNLFDFFDTNKDGTLEESELDLIAKGMSSFSGADKTLDANENSQLASVFAKEAGIENVDFMGFVKEASKASADIISSEETITSDGGKQIVTYYKNGTKETIAYYPNGEYKFKHTEKHVEKTTVTYSVQGNPNKQYTAEELDAKIKEAYNKEVQAYKKASAQSKSKDSPYSVSFVQNPGSYKDYKKDFMQRYNIVSNTNTSREDIDNLELSELAKQDAAVRDFVLSHFIETHKTAQENLDSMGILDDIGAAINAGAGELFSACKNIYNKHFGDGTEEDYKNFYELAKKFEPNYDKAIAAEKDLNVMRKSQDKYFSTFEKDVKDYNIQKGVAFQQKTEQYQQAQVLKQRIELLKKARFEVEQYQNEQEALVHGGAVNDGTNPASHITNANNLLLQCFDNDQEAVNLLLNGSLSGNEGNAASAAQIQALIDETEKTNAAVLGGKTFDEIKGEYNQQYKEMYGVDFVPDELNDKINDAKATGGTVKIAAITIVSILITKSPAMANIMGAAAGSEAASGASAAFIRTLVSKYGQTVVQQGIKFAMSTGTLATDVGLTLLNQVTDNREGVQWNEVGEAAKGSAKFIYFGAYIGSPLAQAVSQKIGSLGLAGKLMSGGAKTTQGAITTTTISGDKLVQNFMNTSKSLLAKSGAFATEVGAFSGLELATGDVDPTKVFGEQAEMLTQLKLMNHVLEYMLGGKVHTAIQRANMEAAIEKSGVKNWTVKEIKTPKGAQYMVEMDGVPLGRFENANDLAAAMVGRISMALKNTQGEQTEQTENDKTGAGAKVVNAGKQKTMPTNISAQPSNVKVIKSSGSSGKAAFTKMSVNAFSPDLIKQSSLSKSMQKEIIKMGFEIALKKSGNEYLMKNKKYAKALYKEMSEMKQKDFSNKECERFTNEDITKILSTITEQNKEIVENLIRAKKSDGRYAFSSYLLPDIMDAFDGVNADLVNKFINMAKENAYMFSGSNVQPIKDFLQLAEKYPEAMETVSANYSQCRFERCFDGELEPLLDIVDKIIKNNNQNDLEVTDVLLNMQPYGDGTRVSNSHCTKILNAVAGKNCKPKDIMSFVKCTSGMSSENEMFTNSLNKFADTEAMNAPIISGELYDYEKTALPTEKEIYGFMKSKGLSEDECIELSRSDLGVYIVQMYNMDKELNIGGFSRLCNRNNIMSIKNGLSKEEIHDQLSTMIKIFQYITKDNYEKFKQSTGDSTTSMTSFLESLNTAVPQIVNSQIYPLIEKLLGRKLTAKDELLLESIETMNLSSLKEADIISVIGKLKELNLLDKDINVLNMIAHSSDWAEVNATQQIKEFADYLVNHKYIAKEDIAEFLKNVYSDNPEIVQKKIDFLKTLIENEKLSNVTLNRNVMQYLSKNNLDGLQKQISIIQEMIQKDESLKNNGGILKFLNSDDSAIDKNIEFWKKIRSMCDNSYSASSIIETLTNPSNQKIKNELLNFIEVLSSKTKSSWDISEVLETITIEIPENKRVQYMDLYTKCLDYNLEFIGSDKACRELIKLQVTEDVNDLNLREKLKWYEKLSTLDDKQKETLDKIGIDYKKITEKLVNYLGSKRPLAEVNKAQQQMFLKEIIANNNPKAEKVLKEYDFAQYKKTGIPLKYSRNEFNANIENILKDVPQQEQAAILKHFGLEKGAAGFDGMPNDKEFKNTDVGEKGQQAAKQIQNEIRKFLCENEVMIDDPVIKETLDGLIKGLPEFTSIVGKEQHGTHAYSVDIHTLKVLQSAMNNPLYKELSDQDKTIMKIAILLHDLGKKGGVVDEGHAGLSADYAWAILDKFPFPDTMKDRIIDIVDNHHWFEKFNTGKCSAEDVAVRCRRPEDLKIYEIFSKADFENVNESFHLGNKSGGSTTQAEFDKYMAERMKSIEEAVNRIYENANLVFDTQFMQNGSKFPHETVEVDGNQFELKVLNFSDLEDGASLTQYGFAPGVTKENARFTVHMTALDDNMANYKTVLQLTQTPIHQSVWSTSLVSIQKNNTYWGAKYGLIFETPQANISEAAYFNTGSGCGKGLDSFLNFLFEEKRIVSDGRYVNEKPTEVDVRHFVRDNFKKYFHNKGIDLTDEEYATISKYLFKKKYTTQIKDLNVGSRTIKAQDLVEALNYSRDELFPEDIASHNEINPINPKVRGLFAKVDKIEDCPAEFLKFAHEHDLPIILMPKREVHHDK